MIDKWKYEILSTISNSQQDTFVHRNNVRHTSDQRSGEADSNRFGQGSSQKEFMDPFAVKVSIPPLVLLAYVVWKQYSQEDPRYASIRKAEENHRRYLADKEMERSSSEALAKL
jgi:hypothetical protein